MAVWSCFHPASCRLVTTLLMENWFVYMLRCADDSLYTGITTDLARRVAEHNAGAPAGARYTHPRRPVTLVYQRREASRAAASAWEAQLRKKNKADKEELVREAGSRG